MKVKKLISLSLVAAMAAGTLAGCGGSSTTETTAAATTAADAGTTTTGESGADGEMPYAGVTLKWALTDNQATAEETTKLIELVKEKTGIIIEPSITPTTNAGEIDKVLVGLMAGDSIDIIERTPSQLKEFYNAGVLAPLDELAATAGYDVEENFSGTEVKFDDETYGIPTYRDIWLTYYNKKIFDDAGVAYPTADGWTWEKYVETAKQINDPEAGIWGSFMLDYDNYEYMTALQKGVSAYKEDGTSNFDDPAFKDAISFYYGLGTEEKIQPDSIEYASGIYPYNSFMTTGQMGMFVCGGWVASTLTDQTKYPRDWQAGILPMPYPEGEEPSSLTIANACAIPSTSENKDAAFAAIECIADYKYTLGYGRVPGRTNLSDEEIDAYVNEQLVPMFEHDGITAEDIKNAWFDNDRNLVYEKISGVADTSISQIWIEEGQLYGQGAKSLDDTMASIKTRSDEAIAEAAE